MKFFYSLEKSLKPIALGLGFTWLLASQSVAQELYYIQNFADWANEVQWNKKSTGNNPEIAGTPYLNDEFKTGEVYFTGKVKVEGVPLRLNIYSGDMEYLNKNTVMVIGEPGKIEKVVIGDETYIYLDKSQNNQVAGFVQIWNEDLPSIILKMSAAFHRQEPARPYVDAKPDRYERAPDEYYLMTSKSDFERISNVKKLIKSLGSHEEELKSFAKEENISSSDGAGMAALVDYFKQL